MNCTVDKYRQHLLPQKWRPEGVLLAGPCAPPLIVLGSVMRPPLCEICGKTFDPFTGGGTVNFADYEPLPETMTGHPKGCEWFCARHLEAAQALKDQPAAVALAQLRRSSGLWWRLRRLWRR